MITLTLTFFYQFSCSVLFRLQFEIIDNFLDSSSTLKNRVFSSNKVLLKLQIGSFDKELATFLLRHHNQLLSQNTDFLKLPLSATHNQNKTILNI